MKAEKIPIELNGTKHLLFDNNAFYDLDKIYGSIKRLFQTIHTDESVIPHLLHIGLLHEEVVPIEHLELLVDLSNKETLKIQILNALHLALPEVEENKKTETPKTEDGPLEWNMLYYMGTVILHMSEDTFWSCTLRKLFSVIDAHVKFKTPKQEKEPTASDDFINQYM